MNTSARSPRQRKRSIRSLAASAGLRVDEVVARLREKGLRFHGSDMLDPAEMHEVRELLGLRGRREKAQLAPRLSKELLILRCLRPLREKGKRGRARTTPIDNVWGHGVPEHQKDEVKTLVEKLLAAGDLAEKTSQGRRHVWLTRRGQALLARTEASIEA